MSNKQVVPVTDEDPNISVPDVAFEDIKTFENGVTSTNMTKATVVKSEKGKFVFKILEINITDRLTSEPITAFTIGQYKVFFDAHTRLTTYNTNALYYVRGGNAVFWIGDEGKTIPIGNYICVDAGIKHCIYNKGTSDVTVDLIFPGKMSFPVQRK